MAEIQGVTAVAATAGETQPLLRGLAVQRWLSRDSALKWGAIAGIVLADVALCARQDLTFAPANLVLPAVWLALLGIPAAYYYRRGEDRFVLCLTALAQTIAFISSFTVLMYAIASFSRPLCDAQLAAFDAWCGVDVPAIRDWTNARAGVRLAMDAAYGVLLFQLPAIVIVLGLLGERRSLEAFVLQEIVASLLTVAMFAFLPADGPFSFYGYDPSPDQAHYLEHFRGIRNGEMRSIALAGAAGLVTFPSFHTAEALLMALAFRRRRVLFLLFGSLNLLVALSTMTTGWHYFADVAAGLIVGGVSFAAVQLGSPWIYGDRASPDAERAAG